MTYLTTTEYSHNDKITREFTFRLDDDTDLKKAVNEVYWSDRAEYPEGFLYSFQKDNTAKAMPSYAIHYSFYDGGQKFFASAKAFESETPQPKICVRIRKEGKKCLKH